MALFWTQKQDVGPAARIFPAMTFDAPGERVVLFGGQLADGTLMSDTWSWDGGDWTQVSDMGPSPRAGAGMAFDDARERVVLLGGFPATGGSADTWEWDGTEWTQVADTGPDTRGLNGMAYDAVREQVVLFGGADSAGNLLADTWVWDGTEWTQLADTGPEARYVHAMTFDVAGERVLVFGGLNAPPASAALGDTWAWNGDDWKQVADFGPPAAVAASAECDGHAVLLFGGGVSDFVHNGTHGYLSGTTVPWPRARPRRWPNRGLAGHGAAQPGRPSGPGLDEHRRAQSRRLSEVVERLSA